MRKHVSVCVGLLCVLIGSGCGPSLKDYIRQSESYSSRVAASQYVSVNIEQNDVVQTRGMGTTIGNIGAVINAASGVAAVAWSSEQGNRLNTLIRPQNVGLAVSDGFGQNFEGTTHLRVVDASANPDLRIVLTVSDYGLWAESLLSPMNFYVEAEISVIYVPEMKTIYTSGASIVHEVSNIVSEMANAVTMEVYMSRRLTRKQYATFAVINNVGHLAKGAASLAAFSELTDAEIVTVFDYLSYDAGTAIARQLLEAIYD